MFIKDDGKMENFMVMANIHGLMMVGTKEIGNMGFNRDMAKENELRESKKGVSIKETI
jgi:hypothetical protein